jgi:transcriptional regulator with XRE-family HTH domain
MLRKARGDLKQKDVACRVGVAPSTLSRYESGARRVPPELAVQVAVATGREDVLDAYCQGCPVRQFMARRRQLQVFKGGKAA